MPVETAKVIHQLDDSNPRATDPKSQGDDHLRLLKTVLQTTFNGYEGVVLVYGADEGTANAYAVNPEIPVPLYGLGMIVSFEALEANTGPATLNVSGLGALPIVHTTGLPLEAGDIRPGVLTIVQYDGEKFQAIAGSPHLSRVGNQKLTGDFDITGAVSIGGDVVTGGNLAIDGNLAMPGSTTIGGEVDAEGGATFGGNGSFGGNITVSGAGTNDLSAGTTLVKDVTPGSGDSNEAASIRYVNQTALAASLPAQTDNAGKYLRTDGASAFWDLAGAIVRRLVTGSATLGNADQTKLIDCTGTFTLSFEPAATLGDGWNCYVRNFGTGIVTLDPSGAQSIDGLATLVLHPGEVRIVQCDGVSFRTILVAGEQILVVREEQPAGINGGGLASSSYAVRNLNTVAINRIAGASLSANQIQLPAGIYEVYASAPAWRASWHKTRLYNVTSSSALAEGTSEYSWPENSVQTRSFVSGMFQLSTTSIVRLEHRAAQNASQAQAGGSATGFGGPEVYAEITIRKIA